MHVGPGTKMRNELTCLMSWGKQNWNIIRFCLVFFVYIIGILFISQLKWFNNYFLIPLTETTAQLSSWALNMLGLKTQYSHSIVFDSRDFAIEIIYKCTGILQVAFFIAGVLAYQCSFLKKLSGIIIGTIVIFSANLIRIINLFFIGLVAFSWFDFFHGVIWEVLMIIIIFLTWLLWLKRVERFRKNAQGA